MKIAYGLVSIGFLIVLYLALYAIAHKYNADKASSSTETPMPAVQENTQ